MEINTTDYSRDWLKLCDNMLAAKCLGGQLVDVLHTHEEHKEILQLKEVIIVLVADCIRVHELSRVWIEANYSFTREQADEFYLFFKAHRPFKKVIKSYQGTIPKKQFCGVQGQQGEELYNLCFKFYRKIKAVHKEYDLWWANHAVAILANESNKL